MPIVGTAGHVDHGKSTLVRALTGTDPDRWAEEKQRGLTIDLGFAWTDIGGHDVGFVDVPGHERFIKNMLAGVGGVDCALLVVAADSGWMPQTEEHASVLDLLDTRNGIIALTRIDLVDADTLELATLELMDEVRGTNLEGWPIVPVSGVAGTGLDELRRHIASTLEGANSTNEGAFRMWIDRSFSIAGAGRVVTGTVLSGAIRVGDELELLPAGGAARVRALQHHGGSVEEVGRGDRAAINLTGAHDDLERGHLIAVPATNLVTDRIIATLRPTRSFEQIPDRGAFHIHVGTASRPATVRALPSGEFMIRLDDAVPAQIGDRVILRDSGRRTVVGGGRVVDPVPIGRPDLTDRSPLVGVLDDPPNVRASAVVLVHGSVSDGDVGAASGGGTPSGAVHVGAMWVAGAELVRLARDADAMVEEYHREHPVRPGIPKSELASRLGVSAAVIDAVIADAASLEESDGAVRAASHRNVLTDEDEAAWESTRNEWEASFNVPRLRDMALDEEIVHFVLRRGDLVRIAEDLAFTAGQIDAIQAGVSELEDGFTVAEFRDHFGMARRQAVPTLEWLDSIGKTRRSGDGRTVRR